MNTAVDIAQLPSLPLARRMRLPDVPAIYFAISSGDEVLYVGRTVSLFARWQAHHRKTQLMSMPGVRIAWLSVDDAALLPEIERALIKHFNPVLNRSEVPRSDGQKIAVGLKVSRPVFEAIAKIAKREDRTVSGVIERLLRTHPRIQQILEVKTTA